MISLARNAGSAAAGFSAGDPEQLQSLARAFGESDHVVLPGLFAPDLLDWVQEELGRAAFDARDYAGLAGELTLDYASPLVARLLFLLNDPALHRAVDQITGAGPIRRFDGRIYRRLPIAEHYDNWHDDLAGAHRVVTMSVNLGSEPYGGGELLLRRKREPEPFAAVHNVGPGDALIFRIDPGLEHRVTSIASGVKTALAGWFGTSPPWPQPVADW